MPQHRLLGRCTHVYNKPCHSTDYREDATPGTNNKPCHSTDYWEDVHMYLINLATTLTTGKMYTYI
jgi:hypothetical protein